MRRLLVLIMLCLLPLQISWAAVANYCGHEQDKTAQHFGHHGDEHTVSSDIPDDGAQAGKSNPTHDHCHLSCFMGILSASHLPAIDFSQPSLHCDNRFPSSLAPDKPERPKWSAPA